MKKYNLIMNCKECNELFVNEARVIEYAKNRLLANPEDINDFGFDAEKIGIDEATYVINFYGEEVQEVVITNSLSMEEKRAYRTGEMPNSPNYKKQCAINRLRS